MDFPGLRHLKAAGQSQEVEPSTEVIRTRHRKPEKARKRRPLDALIKELKGTIESQFGQDQEKYESFASSLSERERKIFMDVIRSNMTVRIEKIIRGETITEERPIRPKDLAYALGIPRPAITACVTKMINKLKKPDMHFEPRRRRGAVMVELMELTQRIFGQDQEKSRTFAYSLSEGERKILKIILSSNMKVKIEKIIGGKTMTEERPIRSKDLADALSMTSNEVGVNATRIINKIKELTGHIPGFD